MAHRLAVRTDRARPRHDRSLRCAARHRRPQQPRAPARWRRARRDAVRRRPRWLRASSSARSPAGKLRRAWARTRNGGVAPVVEKSTSDAVDAVERRARHQPDEEFAARFESDHWRARDGEVAPSGSARRGLALYSPSSAVRGSVSATPSWARTLCASWPKRVREAGEITTRLRSLRDLQRILAARRRS